MILIHSYVKYITPLPHGECLLWLRSLAFSGAGISTYLLLRMICLQFDHSCCTLLISTRRGQTNGTPTGLQSLGAPDHNNHFGGVVMATGYCTCRSARMLGFRSFVCPRLGSL
jgi:hypothetical protein